MAFKYNCPICNCSIGYEGLCWRCKAEKEREAALALSTSEIQDRQQYLIEHLHELNNMDDPARKYFWDCLSLHGVVSVDLQRAAVREKVFWPVEIYYQAPADVRDALIENLMTTTNSHQASHIMCCLAMQGDDVTLKTLFELKKNPKAWRKELYVDPDIYAQQGGWSFDEIGNRQYINFNKCFSFEKKNSGDTAVTIGKARADMCPHCKGKLIDILSVNGMDKRLRFLGVEGKITATCCPSCICFTEAGYSRYHLDGSSEVCFPYTGLTDNERNYVSEENYNDLQNNGLELSDDERPLFYDANNWDAVTLGGFAFWVQDCVITNCPDCGKPMRYLAQLSWERIMNDACEGILYVEVCPECKVVSMHHQQT